MNVIDRRTGREFRLNVTTPEIERDLDRFYRRECRHVEKTLKRIKLRDGRTAFQDQCNECGRMVGPHKSASHATIDTQAPDPNISADYTRRREEEKQSIYENHVDMQRSQNPARQPSYREYLKSDSWRAVRDKVLNRAGYICEGCGERRAILAHHLTYDRAGREMMFDLVALCWQCHDECHPDKAYADDAMYCSGCRWQAYPQGDIEWCGALDMSVVDARSSKDLCDAHREPLR